MWPEPGRIRTLAAEHLRRPVPQKYPPVLSSLTSFTPLWHKLSACASFFVFRKLTACVTYASGTHASGFCEECGCLSPVYTFNLVSITLPSIVLGSMRRTDSMMIV